MDRANVVLFGGWISIGWSRFDGFLGLGISRGSWGLDGVNLMAGGGFGWSVFDGGGLDS